MKTLFKGFTLLPILAVLSACGAFGGASSGPGKSDVIAKRADGTTLKLPSVIFQERTSDPGPKKYALALTDYDACDWAAHHNPSLLPVNNNFLGLYLLNEENNVLQAPGLGTYLIGTPGTNGNYIDSKVSGFGTIVSCKGTYPGLVSGTVTITDVAPGQVAGTLKVVLGDGTTISGPFSSVKCTGGSLAAPPSVDPAACTDLK